MDIQPFYLKEALPAAKASPHYDYPFADEDLAQPKMPIKSDRQVLAPAPGRPTVPAASHRAARDAARPPGLSELKAQLRQPSAKSPDKQIVAATLDAAEVVAESVRASSDTDSEFNFKIHYYHINEQLAVIDELPYAAGSEGQSLRVDLLKAILAALKVNWDTSDLRTESFSWPFDTPVEIEGDAKLAAQQILQGYIAQRHAVDKFNNLLVFGGQLETLLTSPEAAESGFDFFDKPQGYHLTLTSTLSAMLSYPLLKRQVWAHLQALKKRLAEG